MVFYPSHIKLFRQCPEQYHHKYVERLRVEEPFSRPLQKGIAVHSLLAGVFDGDRTWRPDRQEIQDRAELILPYSSYPDDLNGFWAEDIGDVVTCVDWTIDQVDPDVKIIGVERTLGYNHRLKNDSLDPFVLRAKVDLVVSHAGGEIEHIDFKTGKVKRDSVQEVISRIVVGAQLGNSQPIRTTTMFAAAKSQRSEILTKADSRDMWQEILRVIEAIQSGGPWPPNPTPLCDWCSYYEHCSINGGSASQEEMTDWLESNTAA